MESNVASQKDDNAGVEQVKHPEEEGVNSRATSETTSNGISREGHESAEHRGSSQLKMRVAGSRPSTTNSARAPPMPPRPPVTPPQTLRDATTVSTAVYSLPVMIPSLPPPSSSPLMCAMPFFSCSAG
ncbi:unnamed protein product [Gongylonema pulchrum]|uniref:Uncharacterized protein n=1 Tax=Gongylonema pulchrum TaxID=637853 RepID=A0A183E8Z8_9BILA|nr:unnamed protein product [Gongylonema pulchrum]